MRTALLPTGSWAWDPPSSRVAPDSSKGSGRTARRRTLPRRGQCWWQELGGAQSCRKESYRMRCDCQPLPSAQRQTRAVSKAVRSRCGARSLECLGQSRVREPPECCGGGDSPSSGGDEGWPLFFLPFCGPQPAAVGGMAASAPGSSPTVSTEGYSPGEGRAPSPAV